MENTKMQEVKKARFWSKPESLERLKVRMNTTPARYLPEPQEYIIDGVIGLAGLEYRKLVNGFLMIDLFERGEEGGHEEINGRFVRKAIKVYNRDNPEEYFITDPQGFGYCRYVALV